MHLLLVSTEIAEEVLMSSQSGQIEDHDPPRTPTTLAKLLDEYGDFARRVRDLAEETIQEQRLYIDRFVTAQGVSAPAELFDVLTSVRVQRFLFEYAENHGPGSRRWMQTSLRSFLRFCHYRRYVSRDFSIAVPVFRRRRLASVPKGIDDDTVGLLLEGIDQESQLGMRDVGIILLLTTYGVRGIQVRRLRLDDIDWTNNRIHFQAVKGGMAVVQYLTPQVGNALLAYIRNGRPNTVPYTEVFLSSRAPFRPFLKSGSLSGIIHRRLQQFGVELPQGVSHGTHSFRHGFAARLTGEFPLKYIADMLGHRDLSSTYMYSKVDFKALSETALPWPKEGKR